MEYQVYKRNKIIVLCPKRDPRLVLVPLQNTIANTVWTFSKTCGIHCTMPENSGTQMSHRFWQTQKEAPYSSENNNVNPQNLLSQERYQCKTSLFLTSLFHA